MKDFGGWFCLPTFNYSFGERKATAPCHMNVFFKNRAISGNRRNGVPLAKRLYLAPRTGASSWKDSVCQVSYEVLRGADRLRPLSFNRMRRRVLCPNGRMPRMSGLDSHEKVAW